MILHMVECLDHDGRRRVGVLFKVRGRRLAGEDAHEVDASVVRDRLVRVESVANDGDLLRLELREHGREERRRRLAEHVARLHAVRDLEKLHHAADVGDRAALARAAVVGMRSHEVDRRLVLRADRAHRAGRAVAHVPEARRVRQLRVRQLLVVGERDQLVALRVVFERHASVRKALRHVRLHLLAGDEVDGLVALLADVRLERDERREDLLRHHGNCRARDLLHVLLGALRRVVRQVEEREPSAVGVVDDELHGRHDRVGPHEQRPVQVAYERLLLVQFK